MNTLKEIKTTLYNHRKQFFDNYPIESLAIFGSYARNEQNEKSDLDLLVEFNDKIGIRFIDLADEIESLFDLKIELVSRNGIKQKYFESIKQELVYV